MLSAEAVSALARADLETAKEEVHLVNAPKYEVTLADWKGPYDVLLDVIQERELNLLDLDISSLLEGYLAYLERAEIVDVDEAGEFLVVGSTLAQIKSKLMLPKDEQVSDEEEKDPREELVRYLQEYQRVKAAADMLREMPLLNRDVFLKGHREIFEGVEGEGRGNLFQLVKGFQKILREAKPDIQMEFEREEVSVADRFHEIFGRVREQRRVTFLELLEASRSKLYIICTFLALLELVRLKKMKVIPSEGDLPIVLEFCEGAEDDLAHSEFDQTAPIEEENHAG